MAVCVDCRIALRCGSALTAISRCVASLIHHNAPLTCTATPYPSHTRHYHQYSMTRTFRAIKYKIHRDTSCTFQQPKRALYSTPRQRHRLWQLADIQQNPLSFLNEFSVEPVLPPDDQLFDPDSSDVHAARELFRNAAREGRIRTQKGVVNLEYLPRTEYPEIAFLGRSNVGKSSLIKSIFNTPSVKVSVSKKPGHTRVLKFYHVGLWDDSFSLVDMPGYGYNMPEYFVESMEQYLKTRKQLTKMFLLIDGKIGLQPADELAIAMLEEFSKGYVIIMTKIDKSPPSRVLNHVLALQKSLHQKTTCCFPQPFLVSSTNAWGVPMLQSFITYITGAQTLKSIS